MTSPSLLPPLESCPRDYSSPPPFFPRPPSLSPHSPISLTFSQRDYEQESSLELNCHSNIATRRQAFKTSAAVWFVGTSLRSTEQHLQGVNYNRGSASSRRPTRGGQRHWGLKKKRQRHRHAHHWQQLTRARFPGGQFPAKFGC